MSPPTPFHGSVVSRSAVIQTVFGAAVTTGFIIMLNFVADVRGDQSEIASKFEERTQRTNQELKGQRLEINRLRDSDQNLREVVAQYKSYMDNLQAFSTAMENTNQRLVTLEARAAGIESTLQKIDIARIVSRLEVLEKADDLTRVRLRDIDNTLKNRTRPYFNPGP